MKTMQELYNEIMASKELKEQAIEAAKAGKQEEFLKAHGCGATLQEVQSFLEAKQGEDAPLSVNELENAAGGECNNTTGRELVTSFVSLGLSCVVEAAVSASTGYVGQQGKKDGRLCND